MGADLDAIRSLCDALEWLLVPWGHKHRGAVRVSDGPLVDARVWTNKNPDAALWADGLPEAEIRLDVMSNRAPWYGLCGSREWGDATYGAVCRKLLRAIEARGWAVQSIGSEGVLVARIEGER